MHYIIFKKSLYIIKTNNYIINSLEIILLILKQPVYQQKTDTENAGLHMSDDFI